MRLRELELPIGVLHTNYLAYGDSFDWFERQPVDEVKAGSFDSVHIIDENGTEFSVKRVFLSTYPWWQRLPIVGIRGVGRIDLELSQQETHSVKSLRIRLLSFLREHPDWWWAGESKWNEAKAIERFESAATIKEVIESIGYYHCYSPRPFEGKSEKVSVLA